MVLQFEKAIQKKKKRNGKIGRRNFFCYQEDRQPLKMVDPSKFV